MNSDLYLYICLCGHSGVTPTRETRCPHCGLVVVLEWPGDGGGSRPVTITEREGLR